MKHVGKNTSSKVKAAERAAPSKSAGVAASRGDILPEERHRMIATAAYYRAECRDFAGDCALEDWLAAEAEIDQRLERCRSGDD